MIVFSKMQTFILYIILLLLFWTFASKAEKNNNSKYLLPIVLFWGLITGLRSESVGIDTSNYHYLYTSGYYTWLNDIGFVKLTEFLSKFLSFNGYLCVISTIMALGFVYGIWELHKQIDFNFSWCIVILFATSFLQSMNATRQYFALSFVCFSLHYLFEQKYFKYFLLMLLAISFHASCVIAFLFLPISIIVLWKNHKETTKSLILLSIPIIIMMGGYLFYSYLGNIVVEKANTYLSSTNPVNGPFGILQLMFIVVMVVFSTIEKTQFKEKKNGEFSIFAVFSIIAIIGALGGLLGYFFKFMDRIFLSVNIFLCIFYASTMHIEKQDNKVKYSLNRIFCTCTQVFLVFYPFFNVLVNDGYSVMNYSVL